MASAILLKNMVLSLAMPPVVDRTKGMNTPRSTSLTLSPYSRFFIPSCIRSVTHFLFEHTPRLDFLRKLYGITPTRVVAKVQGLSQKWRSVTSLNKVQTFYTGRCATISSLALVAFSVDIFYTASTSIHYGVHSHMTALTLSSI